MKRMIPLALGLMVFAPTGCVSMKGKPAPDFALKDLGGKTVRLSSFKGKPVLLCFWAVG